MPIPRDLSNRSSFQRPVYERPYPQPVAPAANRPVPLAREFSSTPTRPATDSRTRPQAPVQSLSIAQHIVHFVAQQTAAVGHWLLWALAEQGNHDIGGAYNVVPLSWGYGGYGQGLPAPLHQAVGAPHRLWPAHLQIILQHQDYRRLKPTVLTPQERAQANCCITLQPLDALTQPTAVRAGRAVQVYAFDALLKALHTCPQRGPQTPDGVPITDILRVVQAPEPTSSEPSSTP
jgi:hypothetical protein